MRGIVPFYCTNDCLLKLHPPQIAQQACASLNCLSQEDLMAFINEQKLSSSLHVNIERGG